MPVLIHPSSAKSFLFPTMDSLFLDIVDNVLCLSFLIGITKRLLLLVEFINYWSSKDAPLSSHKLFLAFVAYCLNISCRYSFINMPRTKDCRHTCEDVFYS